MSIVSASRSADMPSDAVVSTQLVAAASGLCPLGVRLSPSASGSTTGSCSAGTGSMVHLHDAGSGWGCPSSADARSASRADGMWSQLGRCPGLRSSWIAALTASAPESPSSTPELTAAPSPTYALARGSGSIGSSSTGCTTALTSSRTAGRSRGRAGRGRARPSLRRAHSRPARSRLPRSARGHR